MENLAPNLQLALCVRISIESGESVRTGIRRFISRNRDTFAQNIWLWLAHIESGSPLDRFNLSGHSAQTRVLLEILARGLAGQSILSLLSAVETELRKKSECQMDEFVSTLPIKLFLPLALCMFPAFLLLLFAPLIRSFLGGLG